MQTREERALELARTMLAERERQIAKFGAQLNVPCLPPGGPLDVRANLEPCLLLTGSEGECKAACDEAFSEGKGSWASIAIEELAEAIDAPNADERRTELVQLATVIMAWIEAIDSRAGRFGDPDAEPCEGYLGVGSYVCFDSSHGSVGRVISMREEFDCWYIEWVYGRNARGEVVKATSNCRKIQLREVTKGVYDHMRDRRFNSGRETMPKLPTQEAR